MIRAKHVCLPVVIAVTILIALALASCTSQPPAPANPTAAPATATSAPPPAPATATTAPAEQPTAAPKETATAVVAPPTTAPNATTAPAATPSATPRKVVVPPKPTSSGALAFTVEFGQSLPRESDKKVQMTIILHIAGGAAPYKALEDNIPQTVTKTSDGVKYTRDWADCKPPQPRTVTVVSADGQSASLAIMIPYTCQ